MSLLLQKGVIFPLLI